MASTGELDDNEIVVVGSCMIDFVGYTPTLPNPGETVHGNKFVTNFGGKGANQCVAAAKLGANTALVARVGDDQWGEKYTANLNFHNVNTRFVLKTRSESSGIAQINVCESDGQNQIVIIPGANNKLSVDDVDNAASIITNAKVLIVQLETSASVAIRAMKLCKGISILNGAPALQSYDPELLKLPTIFCVNEIEAAQFTKLPTNNLSQAIVAAKALLSRGCHSVLITLGKDGAMYMDSKEVCTVPSPAVNCVDSTGAGDSFIGALAYLLVRRKDLGMSSMLETACLIASDSVTRRGTQISFPDQEILNKINV